MRWQPLPIVGGSYRDDTRDWSAQDTINFIPVAAEKPGARSSSMLRRAPGFSLFCDTGSGPIRKLHNVEGTLFAVAGNDLFQVNVDSTISASLGTIHGVGRTPIAHNQIAGGNQVVIAANNSGYVYNTFDNTFQQITDDGFPGAVSFDYINQFIVGIDPSRNFAFTSDLADALSYNTLDRVQAESQPDKLVGQIVTHGEWWLFGERTIQPFQDTGAGTGTFQAAQNEIMEVGCASGSTICRLDNSVFWLGNDGIVYRANGYTPQRISTHAIEAAIAGLNWSQAFAFTFEDRGHKVYYLTFPDGQTWGYDAASGEWHRRKSYGLNRWRINDLVFWNGGWYAGDYANGKIYKLDWDVQQEAGAILERRRILSVVADDQNPLIINALEIVASTGGKPALSTSPNGDVSITGDMPGGFVGDGIDYAYTIAANYRPTTCAVTSGALPTGCSIDNNGVVTGTVTAAATYTWTVTVTDAKGNTASVDDTADFTEVQSAQLSDWKYLQVADTDDTDYSAADFDDSSWTTGTAPFGDWYADPSTGDQAKGAPTGVIAAHTFDSRFATDFATTWDTNTRLWLRRTLTLSSVPPGGIKITYYMDDHFTLYVNGSSVFSSADDNPNGGAGSTFTIAESNMVVGDNSIAVFCHDEEPPTDPDTSVTYFDCVIEAAS